MGRRRGLRAAAVAAALLATALPATAFPVATAAEDGLWWVEAMKVDDAHQQVTGEGVTIALLDAPLWVDAPELQGQDVVPSGTRCRPPIGEEDRPPELTGPPSSLTSHATAMAGLLVGNGAPVSGIAPDATLRTYTVFDGERDVAAGRPNLDCLHAARDEAEFLREVLADDPDIVVVPLGNWFPSVQHVVNEGIADGVIFVASAGNDGPESPMLTFGHMHGVVNVVAGTPTGGFADFNSHGVHDVYFLDEDGIFTQDPEEAVMIAPTEAGAGRPTILAPGVDILISAWVDGRWHPEVLSRGTSNAAVLTAGALALAMERWPDAGGNQVLQSMVRNANRTFDHGYDTHVGYGGLSLSALLAEDPNRYPDVHPFYGGLRWPFEDDPPAPLMAERERFDWQPTYAADELDLPYPRGPLVPVEETPTPTPAPPTTTESSAAPGGDGGGTATGTADGSGRPWVWAAGGGALLVVAATVGALWRRRTVATPSPQPDAHAEGTPA